MEAEFPPHSSPRGVVPMKPCATGAPCATGPCAGNPQYGCKGMDDGVARVKVDDEWVSVQDGQIALMVEYGQLKERLRELEYGPRCVVRGVTA